jgi:hypothetical protein
MNGYRFTCYHVQVCYRGTLVCLVIASFVISCIFYRGTLTCLSVAAFVICYMLFNVLALPYRSNPEHHCRQGTGYLL